MGLLNMRLDSLPVYSRLPDLTQPTPVPGPSAYAAPSTGAFCQSPAVRHRCPAHAQVLGRGLKDLPRDQIVVATKVGRYGQDVFDFSAARVKARILASQLCSAKSGQLRRWLPLVAPESASTNCHECHGTIQFGDPQALQQQALCKGKS